MVVDASMAIAWLMPDEQTEASLRVLHLLSSSQGIVPSLFRHEVRNILLVCERRNRATPAEVDDIILGLDVLALQDHGDGVDADVIALARAHSLTAYDAACLALAISTGSPLATLDRAMAVAARACGVLLLGPLAP